MRDHCVTGLAIIETATCLYLLAGAIFLYTLLLSCFLDIGEPRQRRPTDVLLLFMCFVGMHLWVRLRRSAATSTGTA